jgi:hypothetical protein
VTRIELLVMKLVTFVYDGPIVPICINQDSKLESADIQFFKATFQAAVSALLNGFPSIENLTLQITLPQIEVSSSNCIEVTIKFMVDFISAIKQLLLLSCRRNH